MGLTQDGLGKALGLTFQQIQKYERGTNRIGASRLMHIANILDVQPAFFFEELPEEIQGFGRKGMSDSANPYVIEKGFSRRETLELVRVFEKITDATVRSRLMDLVVSIGDTAESKSD
jgi:transcriptional regulator with XRE-family HTH domain